MTRKARTPRGQGGPHGVGVLGGGQHQAARPSRAPRSSRTSAMPEPSGSALSTTQGRGRWCRSARVRASASEDGLDDLGRPERAQGAGQRLAHERARHDHHGGEAWGPGGLRPWGRAAVPFDQCGHWVSRSGAVIQRCPDASSACRGRICSAPSGAGLTASGLGRQRDHAGSHAAAARRWCRAGRTRRAGAASKASSSGVQDARISICAEAASAGDGAEALRRDPGDRAAGRGEPRPGGCPGPRSARPSRRPGAAGRPPSRARARPGRRSPRRNVPCQASWPAGSCSRTSRPVPSSSSGSSPGDDHVGGQRDGVRGQPLRRRGLLEHDLGPGRGGAQRGERPAERPRARRRPHAGRPWRSVRRRGAAGRCDSAPWPGASAARTLDADGRPPRPALQPAVGQRRLPRRHGVRAAAGRRGGRGLPVRRAGGRSRWSPWRPARWTTTPATCPGRSRPALAGRGRAGLLLRGAGRWARWAWSRRSPRSVWSSRCSPGWPRGSARRRSSWSGIVVAVAGVVLASGPELSGRAGARPVLLAAVAAVGFGVALLAIAEGSRHSTLMTLVTMRATSVTLLASPWWWRWARTPRSEFVLSRRDVRLVGAGRPRRRRRPTSASGWPARRD